MQIWIKTLTGRKSTFNFEPDVKVKDVKHALQEKEGIQVDQIRLIYSGKQLADEKMLEEYNVTAGAVIHMVLQLRGGSFYKFNRSFFFFFLLYKRERFKHSILVYLYVGCLLLEMKPTS